MIETSISSIATEPETGQKPTCTARTTTQAISSHRYTHHGNRTPRYREPRRPTSLLCGSDSMISPPRDRPYGEMAALSTTKLRLATVTRTVWIRCSFRCKTRHGITQMPLPKEKPFYAPNRTGKSPSWESISCAFISAVHPGNRQETIAKAFQVRGSSPASSAKMSPMSWRTLFAQVQTIGHFIHSGWV